MERNFKKITELRFCEDNNKSKYGVQFKHSVIEKHPVARHAENDDLE